MTINAQDSLGGGCLSYMFYTVSITGITPTCQAQFAYSIDTVNCKIQFTNQSTPGTSYTWLFSGGGSSAATNPTVSIANQSAITVTLNALNAGQQCGTNTQTIAIAQNKCYTVGMKNYGYNQGIIINQKDDDDIEIILDNLLFNTITITDIRGIIVESVKVNNNPLLIKTSQFSPGIYYLTFNGLKGSVTKKIVK